MPWARRLRPAVASPLSLPLTLVHFPLRNPLRPVAVVVHRTRIRHRVVPWARRLRPAAASLLSRSRPLTLVHFPLRNLLRPVTVVVYRTRIRLERLRLASSTLGPRSRRLRPPLHLALVLKVSRHLELPKSRHLHLRQDLLISHHLARQKSQLLLLHPLVLLRLAGSGLLEIHLSVPPKSQHQPLLRLLLPLLPLLFRSRLQGSRPLGLPKSRHLRPPSPRSLRLVHLVNQRRSVRPKSLLPRLLHLLLLHLVDLEVQISRSLLVGLGRIQASRCLELDSPLRLGRVGYLERRRKKRKHRARILVLMGQQTHLRLVRQHLPVRLVKRPRVVVLERRLLRLGQAGHLELLLQREQKRQVLNPRRLALHLLQPHRRQVRLANPPRVVRRRLRLVQVGHSELLLQREQKRQVPIPRQPRPRLPHLAQPRRPIRLANPPAMRRNPFSRSQLLGQHQRRLLARFRLLPSQIPLGEVLGRPLLLYLELLLRKSSVLFVSSIFACIFLALALYW